MGPGYRFCMLTDGTSGVCGINGMCLSSMMLDLRKERDEMEMPYCTAPIFQEGCGRFCACKGCKGPIDTQQCLKECGSWFSPM